MKVIPFEKHHADEITRLNKATEMPGFDKVKEVWKSGGPAYTVMIDDQIIFCGGIVLMGWNSGEAWTYTTDFIEKYPKLVFKTVKTYLIAIAQREKLVRVQATCYLWNKKGARFLEKLGFEFEGLMKKWGPTHEDALMFALTEA